MSAFTLDIRGQLNSIRLSSSKVLWPLFEAVVNSIHSIEDSNNAQSGCITITALREEMIPDIEGNIHLGKIHSFVIEDNGLGFNSDNYKSFNTAYSTFKIQKGCKGIGRFLWLKAFENVKIESTFFEKDSYFHRNFSFTADGIVPEDNLVKKDDKTCSTKIFLNNYLREFKKDCPLELDVIAKRIIEHCLLYFISDHCPKIILKDEQSNSINLNDYFAKNIKDSLHQDHFDIKNNKFIIYHLRVPEGAAMHELHLCANMQEVSSVELKKHIPDLSRKIIPDDDIKGFYYVGYITGDYLDSIVNVTRTDFEYDEKNGQISAWGTSKEDIISTAVDFVKTYLGDYILDINKKKRRQIDEYVASEKPTYKFLLNKCPEVYDRIPAGLSGDGLDLELHKAVQNWETEIKLQGKRLEEEAKNSIKNSESYDKLFKMYWSNVTDVSKTCLAEYVTRRKTLLKILEETLTINSNGKFQNENAIHSIICPMQHTSNDISFEEMNLWIVDERLAYHKYLASDKTLKSMPVVDSSSTKEPDIAIFDQAFAYSDSDDPLTSVTIIEFKKPDNDTKNPINQIGEYIDEIKKGRKKKASGQSFNVTDGTMFRGYVICDLTDKMRTHCMNSGLAPTADNLGYSGYNQMRRAYIEVISYSKLLADAKKRNEIFFNKLFTPQLHEDI